MSERVYFWDTANLVAGPLVLTGDGGWYINFTEEPDVASIPYNITVPFHDNSALTMSCQLPGDGEIVYPVKASKDGGLIFDWDAMAACIPIYKLNQDRMAYVVAKALLAAHASKTP